MISKDRRYAFQRYRDFVESGIDESLEDPLKKIYGGAILGGKTFFLSLLWQWVKLDLLTAKMIVGYAL
jgi:hypothetical protein